MEQLGLFDKVDLGNKSRTDLGNGVTLEIIDEVKPRAILYIRDIRIKSVDLTDKTAKRLLVVELIEQGAVKKRVSDALDMSRQTIHNYLEIKKQFGLEGLVHGYTPSESRSLRQQRKVHSKKRQQGNKAKQVAELRQKAREAKEKRQLHFSFEYDDRDEQTVPADEQPFSEDHNWQESRYAGVFTYLIPLIVKWQWLQLVIGYFGSLYKVFMIFLLMAARNIRAIEQLKNVRAREAGIVLGIKRLPAKPKVWEWFYGAAKKNVSKAVLWDYFRYQICAGIVGLWLWFTDGHLLPYTGKEAVHFSYNTQRRMPVPGRTSLVTCDNTGRVVDFQIQEGKGDLRSHIVTLSKKWGGDIPEHPVMVFDREGYGAGFFSKLVLENIPFVTWDKYVDSKELAEIEDEKFIEEFEFNEKKYGVFEEEKSFTYIPEDSEANKHSYKLRHIYIWNKTSKRRTCGLAWDGEKEMNTADCARAILSRWGASENTFKHINTRHPLHYHPGFKLVTSDRQEIDNPEIKEKQRIINKLKKALSKCYKKLAKSTAVQNKDGSPRQNSAHERIKKSIQKQEDELKYLEEEKKKLPSRVDVSSIVNYRSFKQIDNEGKNLFDFVLSSVWNVRKEIVEWLRSFFNQDNEVVDLFYAITNSHGWIKSTKKEVIVRLEPLQQPKRRLAQEQLCRKLSNICAQVPNGKFLIIEVGESPI